MKKILIITYYWPPSGGSGVQRWVKFAKYLPHYGIQPVILTVSNPTYASYDESLEGDIPASVPVYRSRSFEPFGVYSTLTGKSKSEVAKPSTRISSGTSSIVKLASWIRANVFVPDARIGWLLSARNRALELIEEHDIQTVVTTGPPHSTHLIGKHLKKKKDLKWIADFRDPWTQVFYNQQLPRTQFIRHLDLKMEKSVLASADEVIVVSPSMVDLQKSIEDRPYQVIPNGFDHKDFTNLKTQDPENEVFTIRHIGTLSETAIPTSLFKALELLPRELNFRLEFIGNVHEQVKKLAEKSHLNDRFVFIDYLTHSRAVQAMAAANLLLLVIPDVKNNELILTGKIFEYIASGRPILMIGPAHGDAAEILNSLGQGRCFDYDEVGNLSGYLEKLIRRKHRKNTPSSITDPAQHPYSRLRQAGQLAELIK